MKGFILFAGLLLGMSAMAETRPSFFADPDFSVLIAEGYGEQADTYQRIHAEVESASREGEILEDLAKKSKATEVDMKLTKAEEKKERHHRADRERR